MTSPLLTPEIVERAARAIHADYAPDFPNSLLKWDDLPEYDKDCARSQARAALEAVIPSLIEAIERKPETCADARRAAYEVAIREAAAAIEEAPPPNIGLTSEAMRALRKYFALAIRSLIPSKEKDHG